MTSVPPLHGFPKMNRLILHGNKIDKEGFARLNEYLANGSCPLQHLNLAYTGMTDEDISSLAQALKFNRSVAHLYLSGNDCDEAGYRSILKMLIDISSIKATLESNTCLLGIVLPKENDYIYGSDSDSDVSENNTRDGFEEIRRWIHLIVAVWNVEEKSPRERIKESQLNTRNRRRLCEMQGVDYSYSSIFAEIPTCILPELFASLWEDPDKMDPFRALVDTVSSWTSLVDRRLMVEATLERNRALVEQLSETVRRLSERNLDLEETLKFMSTA